jgi:beta-phosphoglucomutase-like phosphatase (HAD superfamily)
VRDVAEEQLRNAGLRDNFDAVILADSVRALKPAPAPYLAVAEAFNTAIGPHHVRGCFPVERPLMSDARSGVQSGRSPGCVSLSSRASGVPPPRVRHLASIHRLAVRSQLPVAALLCQSHMSDRSSHRRCTDCGIRLGASDIDLNV